MRSFVISTTLLLAATALVQGQASPAADTSLEINGKKIAIKYSAPSLKGRKMLGPDGRIGKDGTYPVWRFGANNATALHTDATLDFGGLKVPPGDYTLYAKIDGDPWTLIVSKQTGQWGTVYKADQDLGRVAMKMSKPSAPVETMKLTLSSEGGNKGKLQMEFDNTIASIPFTAQ